MISNQSSNEYSVSINNSPDNNTAESTELLQARLDIHDLQERVGILEHTLASVLERVEEQLERQEERHEERQEKRLERQQMYGQVSASHHQMQMPSPIQHSYITSSPQTSSPQTPHRFLQPARSRQPPKNPARAKQPDNTDPSPLPLHKEKVMDSAMPSSEIKKEKLQSKAVTLSQNQKLRYESKAPTLALRLAKLTYFGEDVMARCTPNGCRDQPALPRKELYELKSEIFRLFPLYWCNPVGFEALWGNCLTSIEQGCKRLRRSAIANQAISID